MQPEENINRGDWCSDGLYFKNTDVAPQEFEEKKANQIRVFDFQSIPQATKLLSVLSQIDFNRLVSLNIEKCNIDSVELLSRINMKAVKSIRLTHNNLVSIRSLRKGHWINLQFLNLKENKIQDFEWLTQLNLRSKDFQSLTLHTRRQKNKTVNHDISWIAKLEPTSIENINHFIQCKNSIQVASNYQKYKRQQTRNIRRRNSRREDNDDQYEYEYEYNQWDLNSQDFDQYTLQDKIGFKLKALTSKYGKKAFDISNCFDLH